MKKIKLGLGGSYKGCKYVISVHNMHPRDAEFICFDFDSTELSSGATFFYYNTLPPKYMHNFQSRSTGEETKLESTQNIIHNMRSDMHVHGKGSVVLIKIHKTGSETLKSMLLDVAATAR